MMEIDSALGTTIITSVTSIILAIIAYLQGHKRGRNAEKKSLEKDLLNVPR